MTRKPSTTSLQKKWCNSTSSDIVTCFSVRHASGVTTQNSKTHKPTNTQTMPKSVLRTIVYHLTKAQNALACGEPAQHTQREINYAKALIEKFLDPNLKVEDHEITAVWNNVDRMSESLHIFDCLSH